MQQKRKKTVLIIDDSAFMRGLIRDVLQRNGYRVVGEAENGEVGVEKFKQLRPDIVTSDVIMGEASGLSALEQIIAHNPDAKVVMISSIMEQKPVAVEALEKGAAAIVTKPVIEKELIEALSGIFPL